MARVRKLGSGPSLRDLKARVLKLPTTVAAAVAKDAAPLLSSLAQASFDAGETVYGDARPEGKRGPVKLYRTGLTRRSLRFSAEGTKLRAVLSAPYMRFLIGKYRVLPVGERSALPVKWQRALDLLVERVVGEQLEGRRAA